MQQKCNTPLWIAVQLFMWFKFAVDLASAQSPCTPLCVAGELSQEVFNTNGQYACVASLSPSLVVATPSVTSPAAVATATPNLSSIPAGCQTCGEGQMCAQDYNAEEYHCVSNATKSATSRTSSPAPAVPAGCQACALSQLCQQVYNSNQYHCVENPTAVAAPAPSKSAALPNISDDDLDVRTSPCNSACSDNERCQQVFNSEQYACQPIRGPAAPAASSTPVEPSLGDPAVTSEAASLPASSASLSGEQSQAVTPLHNSRQQIATTPSLVL